MKDEKDDQEESTQVFEIGMSGTSGTQSPEGLDSSAFETCESTAYSTSATSSDLGSYLYSLPSNFDILREANFGEETPQNSSTVHHVRVLVAALQDILLKNRPNIHKSSLLPPLKFRWLEDNSALIELIFKDFRIGFSIEPNVDESGWYLVANDNLKEFSESGPLEFNNLEPLLYGLINFALSNS